MPFPWQQIHQASRLCQDSAFHCKLCEFPTSYYSGLSFGPLTQERFYLKFWTYISSGKKVDDSMKYPKKQSLESFEGENMWEIIMVPFGLWGCASVSISFPGFCIFFSIWTTLMSYITERKKKALSRKLSFSKFIYCIYQEITKSFVLSHDKMLLLKYFFFLPLKLCLWWDGTIWTYSFKSGKHLINPISIYNTSGKQILKSLEKKCLLKFMWSFQSRR